MKTIWNFIFENWDLLSPILYGLTLEIALRLWPTKNNVSIIDNVWKLFNKVIPNIRVPQEKDEIIEPAILPGNGSPLTKQQRRQRRNRVLLNVARHVLGGLVITLFLSYSVNAQLYTTTKGFGFVNADSTTARYNAGLLNSQYGPAGYLYYNKQSNKWRIFYDSAWHDLIRPTPTGNFWPLNGTGTFTDNVTIDGGAFNWNLNAANGFQTYSTFFAVDADEMELSGHTAVSINANQEPSTVANIRSNGNTNITANNGLLNVFSKGVTMTNPTGNVSISAATGNSTLSGSSSTVTANIGTATLSSTSGANTVVSSANGNISLNAGDNITVRGANGLDLIDDGGTGYGINITTPAPLDIEAFDGVGGGSINFHTETLTMNLNGDTGGSGYFLGADGFGNVTWQTPPGGGTPAGVDTEIQYNASGSFGAESAFSWNRTNDRLNVGTTSSGSGLVIGGTDPLTNMFIVSQTGAAAIASRNIDPTSFTISSAAGTSGTNRGQALAFNAGAAYSVSGNGNGGNIDFQAGLPRGSGTPGDINISLANGGDFVIESGIVSTSTIKVNDGANEQMGTVTLVAGFATVNNTKVTANTRIFLSVQLAGGSQGFLSIPTRVAGTSFNIQSTNAAETSTVAWFLVEPN